MKRFLLHVGMAKTGTSALQSFLASNRDGLRAEGWDYPDLSNNQAQAVRREIGAGNGLALARLLNDQGEPNIAPFFEQLARAQSNIIVSSEFFTAATSRNLERVSKRLESLGFSAKVLMYVRPQDEYLEAEWGQLIKRHNQTEPFSAWLLTRIGSPAFVKSMNWMKHATRFAKVFGDENVEIGWYPKICRERTNGLLLDCLERIDVTPDENWRFPDGRLNPTISLGAAEVLRAANELKPDFAVSDRLLELFNRHGIDAPAPRYLSRAERALVRKVFEVPNRQLFQEHLPELKFAAELPLMPDAREASDEHSNVVLEESVRVLSMLVADLIRDRKEAEGGL